MFNIKYMGKLENEEQLIEKAQLPARAVAFEEGEDIQDIFVKGFLLALPCMVILIILTINKVRRIDYTIKFDFELVISIIIMFLTIKALTYVHELIHGLCFPLNCKKTVWKYFDKGVILLHSDARVSKIRSIIINMAPSIILGIIPFIVWYMNAERIPVPYSLVFVFTSWIMVLFSLGDFANTYNTVKQVPPNAKIFYYGLKSYWINE